MLTIYRNYLSNFSFVVLFVSCLAFTIGCGHNSHQKLKVVEKNDPILLRLNSIAGDSTLSKYYSHSHSEDFLEGQMTKKKDEIVEFQLLEKVKRVDSEGRLIIDSMTVEKDGLIDLNDLAFPELEEIIEYVYSPIGQVIKAGSYPKGSIFYIPPMPLPEEPVLVGETWEMSQSWRSLKNGIPLRVQVVAILKNILKCGNRTCADVEISGDVSVINMPLNKMQFTSNINGRILFDVKKGLIIWSQIQSSEDFQVESQQTKVQGCLVSEIVEPEELGLKKSSERMSCQPTGGAVVPPYL